MNVWWSAHCGAGFAHGSFGRFSYTFCGADAFDCGAGLTDRPDEATDCATAEASDLGSCAASSADEQQERAAIRTRRQNLMRAIVLPRRASRQIEWRDR